MLTRREFLKLSAMAGASLALPMKWLAGAPPAFAFAQSQNLKKFIQPLRGIGGAGIPVMQPDTVNPGWWQPGVTHYTINIEQFLDRLHPDLPNDTRLWGYGQDTFRHLGGIIAAQRGTPVQITFRNNLPADHILPVDDTIMGAEGAQNRTSTHLHGGLVPWTSDGGPHAWWDPSGGKGVSFLNNQVLRPGQTVPNNEAEYYYPNNQGSRFLWYHDHALGITRLNAYAGIASAYVITDAYEAALVAGHNLPGPLDPRTVYLVFQDKVFVSDTTATDDPTWFDVVQNSQLGDLWYAHIYEAEIEDPPPPLPIPDPSVVPEFFGDTILVNGTVYPFLEVEQRQYRFRMLNACNARFLNPHLLYAKGSSFPDNTEPSSKNGPAFIQIGTEGGFIPFPVMFNGVRQASLLLAPAERADLIVDFRGVPAGSTLLLCNETAAPFPDGDPVIETAPGFGPNTRTLLQIRVNKRAGGANPPITLPGKFTPTDPFLVAQKPGKPTAIPQGVGVRYLTLNEDFDGFGRLLQLLGTNEAVSPGLFGRAYDSAPTEVIPAGTTEVWEIANLSADTHPIHFHLVNVQVLSRQAFDVEGYTGGVPTYTGPAFAPGDNELGWKETVRMNPGEVTRVLMKFDLPVVPFTVPVSPRPGINGFEYVWHCHILEHEEHDMMRPLVVT